MYYFTTIPCSKKTLCLPQEEAGAQLRQHCRRARRVRQQRSLRQSRQQSLVGAGEEVAGAEVPRLLQPKSGTTKSTPGRVACADNTPQMVPQCSDRHTDPNPDPIANPRPSQVDTWCRCYSGRWIPGTEQRALGCRYWAACSSSLQEHLQAGRALGGCHKAPHAHGPSVCSNHV